MEHVIIADYFCCLLVFAGVALLQVGQLIGRYLALLSALGAVHGRSVDATWKVLLGRYKRRVAAGSPGQDREEVYFSVCLHFVLCGAAVLGIRPVACALHLGMYLFLHSPHLSCACIISCCGPFVAGVGGSMDAMDCFISACSL